MRIVLAPEGTRGDVYPMLALGEHFARNQHEVVFCAPPGFRSDVESRGMCFGAASVDVHDWAHKHAAAFSLGGWRAARTMNRFVGEMMETQFDSVLETTRGADLVIGAGLQTAGPSAAEIHGIPYRYVIYCPVLLPSDEHPPFLVTTHSLPRWLNRLSWWFTMHLYKGLVHRHVNPRRRKLGLAPVQDALTYLVTERPVLAVDPLLASAPRDCPLRVEQIASLHPIQGDPLPPKLESFLESGDPPVYLGFGSMTDGDPARTTRIVLDVVERLGCRALISRGWAGLGDGALPGHVMAVDSVSHASLFPRCAVVVHHGGAGTTTTAARSGVPQVLVPHLADQFYWGHRIHTLGLAPPPVPRNRLSVDRLAEAISSVLDNEFVSEHATDLGQRLRAAHAETADPERLLAI